MRTTILLSLALWGWTTATANATQLDEQQLAELNQAVADVSLAEAVSTPLAQCNRGYNTSYRGKGGGRVVYKTGYRGYGGGYIHPNGGYNRYQYNYYRGNPYRGGYRYPYPYGYGGYGPYGYPTGYGSGFGFYIGF